MQLRAWVEELKEGWPACFGLLQGPQDHEKGLSPELLSALQGEMQRDPRGLELLTLLLQSVGAELLSHEERLYLRGQGLIRRSEESQG